MHPVRFFVHAAHQLPSRRIGQGFTLIELMVIIAIVAVMISLAFPVYQSFSIRAKVTEAIDLAAPTRNTIAETLKHLGMIPDHVLAGFVSPSTQYVQSITVDATGTIQIQTQNTGAVIDPALELEPLGTIGETIRWTCKRTRGKLLHIPENCRK